MFMSILGFIGIGFLLIAAIFMGAIFGLIGAFEEDMLPAGIGIAASMLYLALAVLYFFPVYYLLQFSMKAKKAVLEASSDAFTGAINMLKSHYKFVGIMTIVVMALYPIIIIALVVGGVMSGI